MIIHVVQHLVPGGLEVLVLELARAQAPAAPVSADTLPAITILMAAFNEAAHIATKLRNLATLDYPRDRLDIVIACDGCSDDTAAAASPPATPSRSPASPGCSTRASAAPPSPPPPARHSASPPPS